MKIYAIDTGLLQAMSFRNAANLGPLLENLVFMHLRRHGFEVGYVVSQDGFEVDFLASHPVTGEWLLLQACWDMAEQKTFQRELRGLQNAARRELGVDTGVIVTWDDESALDGTIQALPVWKWLFTAPG